MQQSHVMLQSLTGGGKCSLKGRQHYYTTAQPQTVAQVMLGVGINPEIPLALPGKRFLQ